MKNTQMFSIGEIAKYVGITRKIILNYEAKGLIKPDKKVGATGNRYYTIDTFTQIRTIRVFQEFGLSLDEIREYLNDNFELKKTIKRLEAMRDRLNLTIEKLKERSGDKTASIKEISIEPQKIYRRIYTSTTVEEKADLLRNTALEAVTKYGTDITRRMYFTEYSLNAVNDISYCVAIPEESEGERVENVPQLRAISVFHHGAYEDIPESRNKLLDYAKENNKELSGVFRNIYLEGPPQHKDKSKFITQVVAIIK